MDDNELTQRARSLAAALEPVAGQVYFSPEAHAEYESLGFGPSPGDTGGVAIPEMTAYFCSRGSVMGQVRGAVVAAAFGVFKHELVASIVERGWTIVDADTICAARDRGGIGQLVRVLGPAPDGAETARAALAAACEVLEPYGRPLYAGLAACDRFDDPLADVWRLADRLREYRGDAHVSAWTNAGLDACQIGVLTELYWGMRPRSYSRTRMWSDDDFDAAEAALSAGGLVHEGELTDAGRAVREEIEVVTDQLCRPFVTALGDDLVPLLEILEPWGAALRAAHAYPAAGPHDLAG